MGAAGCATKKYVRNQTAPLVEHTDQLEGQTAENNRRIRSTDDRAQAGIRQAQGTAEAAGQSAEGANKTAGDAESAANDAVHRADSLDSVVKGLDSYKPVTDVTVTFGFDKSVLTRNDREQLDSFAARVGSARSYILEVTGGTDSTGSAQYNYELRDRRAPVLSDRDWQGQGSSAEHISRRAQAKPARNSAIALESSDGWRYRGKLAARTAMV
jgi:outer membrane protein OmpA-like peptidoglycan-associated protein